MEFEIMPDGRVIEVKSLTKVKPNDDEEYRCVGCGEVVDCLGDYQSNRDTLTFGYGSNYDGQKFIIAICDLCVSIMLEEKLLLSVVE